MTPQYLNTKTEEVISWMENGLRKEEAVFELRSENIGLVTADAIVNKSFSTLVKAYTKEIVLILKKDSTKDIDALLKEKVPAHFIKNVQPIVEEKYTRAIREEVIAKLHFEEPIKNIIDQYQNSRISRSLIKKWIISFYDNLNSRERRVKKSIVVSGFFLLLLGGIFFLLLEFAPYRKMGIRLSVYAFFFAVCVELVCFFMVCLNQFLITQKFKIIVHKKSH